MTLKETEKSLADLDAFVRDLYESVHIMNQQLHSLAHTVMELEARLNGPVNPLKNLGRF